MDDIYNKITKFYNIKGFLERYGSDLYITIFIFLIFFILMSYFIVINNLEPIKNNWVNERCKPHIIPFAGIINTPEGESAFKYTSENFTGCINSILSSIIGFAFEPIYYIIGSVGTIFKELTEAMNSIREMFNKLRNDISNITQEIFGRALNITIPIINIFISAKDMLNKANGIIVAGLYTLLGSYMSLKSLMGVIYQFIVAILLALVVMIVILWATMNFGMAASMTAIFLSIAVPMGIIATLMKNVFHLSGLKGIPKLKKHCFDENTELQLWNTDKTIKISNVDVNTRLHDGSYITSIMQLATLDNQFYNLDNIIVSGCHPVFHAKSGKINVKDHPDSIKIDNYTKPIIYCMGTSNKLISINNTTFFDWDEINEIQIKELQNNARKFLPTNFKNKHIHKHIDGGLLENTKIELQNGDLINIKDIKVNDILKCGEIIFGVIKIYAKNINNICEYYIGDKIIRGANLYMRDISLGMVDTKEIDGIQLENIQYIYHLITNTRVFHLDNFIVCDYNSCLEKFLDNDKNNIILSTIL